MDKKQLGKAKKARAQLEKQLDELNALMPSEKPRLSTREVARRSMAKRRHLETEIHIPKAVEEVTLDNGKTLTTQELEADPEVWLKYFFPDRYYLPWSDVHFTLVEEIVRRAKTGGDQALAAPRGEGKSEVVIGVLVYLLCARISRFPVIVAASLEMAAAIYNEVRYHFETNDRLLEVYPLICAPVRALEGSSLKATKQHVGGRLTRIKWDTRHFILPDIEGSPYGGVCLRYFGMESAIRGVRIRGQRPDFVLVDDPETEQSATSDMQINSRIKLLTRAIAGLGGPDKKISIVLVGTIQNEYCLTSKVTDPKQYPTFNGKRFGVFREWPENKDHWEEYIRLRQADQQAGDETAKNASEYYLSNREEMDKGAIVTNHHRFNPGTEHSTIQAAYNFISDRGLGAFMSECQNEPIPDKNIESLGLTPRIVQGRLHFDAKGVIPQSSDRLTVAIDIGKYASHWVAVAWDADICSGRIVDYGVAETTGLRVGSDDHTIDHAIQMMLRQFREEVVMKFERMPDAVMIDSGDFTQSVYSVIREFGSPFYCIKGWSNRSMSFDKQVNVRNRKLCGDNWNATVQPGGLVLYNINVDHWKGWVHQRLKTRTFDEGNSLVSGSLSLYASDDKREHHSISYHMTAEEFREEFTEGKGLKRYWHILRKNNHWLDATVYASAGANMLGIKLIGDE